MNRPRMSRHGRAAVRCAQIIAQTAKFIREAGGQAEFVLSVRQAGNPNFAFLSRTDRLHSYFRWLVRDNPQVTKAAMPSDADEPSHGTVSLIEGYACWFSLGWLCSDSIVNSLSKQGRNLG
jgi:hypothetical protein